MSGADLLAADLAARVAKLEAALREIAADAYVPISDLPDFDQPNGWRDLAVERINIARAALAMGDSA